jgi:hypothetical protein
VLDGVGPALEERLAENGFCCLEELAHSQAIEACETKGFKPSYILAAQEWLDENRNWKQRKLTRHAKTECWCSGCQRRFSGTVGKSTLRLHELRCDDAERSRE